MGNNALTVDNIHQFLLSLTEAQIIVVWYLNICHM